ncbi:uncharacterized protein LOC132314910 [Cornus florida]|uniref:uncharacterized protein LOC132314910 n=1 Tax=Cornus florida TaxID=4283 RepID=UPI002896D25A|nr:uncharacterized protein LOC132314910 [Cornus florida]
MSMDDLYGAVRPHQTHQQTIYEFGYPMDESTRMTTNEMASNSENSPFWESKDNFPIQEFGIEEGKSHEKLNIVRWKSGKSVDPRLLTLLEIFRELYIERREFFKKIFPGHHDEFKDVFKKVSANFLRKDQMEVQTMQRSLSFGAPKQGEESGLRLQRFKVRTPDLSGAGQGGQSQSQGDTKSTVSK